MRRNLQAYATCQVFLNYPFDDNFQALADAMNFSVVASGMLPICAKDLSVPDRPRLELLVAAIRQCHYSAHDFSRFSGEGPDNMARMNMPIEMGMAVFHALNTQRNEHRCSFFVPTPHEYHAFASDLSGLDPICHHNDDERLLSQMYEWLRSVVPSALFNSQPTVDVAEKYRHFKDDLTQINGGGERGSPSHSERRELMYQICSNSGWWDWRETRMGKDEFPSIPLAWK